MNAPMPPEPQPLIDRIAARLINRDVAKTILASLLGLAPIILATWIGARFEVRIGWLLLFCVAAVVLLLYRFLLIGDPPQTVPTNAGWRLMARWGIYELLTVIVLFGLLILTRLVWSTVPTGWLTWYVIVSIVGVVYLIFVILGLSRHPSATAIKAYGDLILGPVLLAWIFASGIQGGIATLRYMDVVPGSQPRDHAAECTKRVRAHREWQGKRLAVLLSGGGYRAALIHSGMLSVLDEAEIPINLRSTVSGGSIVGAVYASGWTPGEFEDFIVAARPGLPDDLFNFVNFWWGMVVPSYSTGDTYHRHFDRVYFHRMRLGQACRRPTLIVNATDYRSMERATFFPQRNVNEQMAAVVAASGAFPIAFDPVRVGSTLFSDGGIVENLGVEGLRDYLETSNQFVQPTVVIISDASAEPKQQPRAEKPTFLEQGSAALEAQYIALSNRIFALYAGQDISNRYNRNSKEPLRQPYMAAARSLWSGRAGDVSVFILSPTSAAERPRFGPYENVVATVARISTLHEPSGTEAAQAFWVGQSLTRHYLPDICKAVGRDPCPAVPPLTAPTPPGRSRTVLEAVKEALVGAVVFAVAFVLAWWPGRRRWHLSMFGDSLRVAIRASLLLLAVYAAFLLAGRLNFPPLRPLAPMTEEDVGPSKPGPANIQ